MELGTVSAIIGASVALTTAVGGILLKAFVNPVKTKTEANSMTTQDHEDRLRHLESQASQHSIHLENLMKAVDKLVDKIDVLVSYQRQSHDHHND